MSYVNKAIKEAMENGYSPEWIEESTSEHWFGVSQDKTLSISKTLLDPEFWRCLGVARGETDAAWPDGEMRCENKLGRCDERYCGYAGYVNPKYRATQFMESIMDGNSPESFFEQLLSSNK